MIAFTAECGKKQAKNLRVLKKLEHAILFLQLKTQLYDDYISLFYNVFLMRDFHQFDSCVFITSSHFNFYNLVPEVSKSLSLKTFSYKENTVQIV